jgi:hypothetical protein
MRIYSLSPEAGAFEVFNLWRKNKTRYGSSIVYFDDGLSDRDFSAFNLLYLIDFIKEIDV